MPDTFGSSSKQQTPTDRSRPRPSNYDTVLSILLLETLTEVLATALSTKFTALYIDTPIFTVQIRVNILVARFIRRRVTLHTPRGIIYTEPQRDNYAGRNNEVANQLQCTTHVILLGEFRLHRI